MILLSAKELADIYGVSRQTIHKWIKRTDLPYHRTLGGRLRFDPVEVRSFCERQGHEPPARLIELTERPLSERR